MSYEFKSIGANKNNNAKNLVKTQPRPILKKSKDYMSNQTNNPSAKVSINDSVDDKLKKKPLFLCGNEANGKSNGERDSDEEDDEAYEEEEDDDQDEDEWDDFHPKPFLIENNHLKASSLNKKEKLKLGHSLDSDFYVEGGKRSRRRALSPVYIFNSREINRQILRMLVKATDSFLKDSMRQMNVQNDSELITLYKQEFLPKLHNFLLKDYKKYYTNKYSFELGLALSEPFLCDLEELKLRIEQHNLCSNRSSSSVEKELIKKKNAMSLYGSLPSSSFIQAHLDHLHIEASTFKRKDASTKSKVNEANERDNNQTMDEKRSAQAGSASGRRKSIKVRGAKNFGSKAATQKKIVRFADSFGLNLETVRIITNNTFVDAFSAQDESENEHEPESTANVVSKPFLVLIPLFSVRKQLDTIVKLDDYIFDYENKIIKCIIKVRNLAYNKRVFARISMNNWKTFHDLDAMFVNSDHAPTSTHSNVPTQSTLHLPTSAMQTDAFVPLVNESHLMPNYSYDYFGFCIIIPDKGTMDDYTLRIEFALCFVCDNTTYWDNNAGENYKFQCFFNKNS